MNRKYTKETLSQMTQRSNSYRELFSLLGLSPRSYRNIKNRIKEFDIDVSHFETRNVHTKESLSQLAKDCKSFADMLKHLGLRPGGGTQTYIRKKVQSFGIDTSHFLGSGNRKFRRGMKWEDILVRNRKPYRIAGSILSKALIEFGRAYKCEVVGCTVTNNWLGKPIKLQVHHCDGDWLNNSPDNLSFVCPNCHTQTPNYCSGNVQ